MLRRWWLVCGISAALGGVLTAQIPVVDVKAILQWIEQIEKMKEQIMIMRQQYQTQLDQYNHLIWQAKYITNKNTWLSPIRAWQYPVYGNASGKTPEWAAASRDGVKAVDAWLSVISRLPSVAGPYSSHFSAPEITDAKKKDFAQAEIYDGTHAGAFAVLGDVRSVQSDRSAAITRLERDALSDAPEQNTAAALANKQVAAQVIALRLQQDQQKLTAAQVDMSIVRGLLQRDAGVDEMNRSEAFRSGAVQINKDLLSGTARSVSAFKGY